MKLKKLAGNLFFFLGLILLWQLFYTAACDWLKLIKPVSYTHLTLPTILLV